MGNSLTVEQRSLTPSVLVRIQVPQPFNLIKPLFSNHYADFPPHTY